MKLYVSGGIHGLPRRETREAFRVICEKLTEAGYQTLNPYSISELGNSDVAGHWARIMRGDIAGMMECDGVATHGDWRLSEGARLETETALRVDMPVAPWQFWMKLAEEAGPIMEM